MSKKKNVSQKVRNGTILQTRDDYIFGSKGYIKPGYKKKGNYRKVAVIDSNKRDDLAIVKLFSSSGQPLKGTTSRYKPFVEILDNKGKRIRIGAKFLDKGQRLSKENVAIIKKIVLIIVQLNIRIERKYVFSKIDKKQPPDVTPSGDYISNAFEAR